ncbi:MAG: hypothetical protein AAGG75_25775 [Bacteroidota bacterium]
MKIFPQLWTLLCGLLLLAACGSDDDILTVPQDCGEQFICWRSTLNTNDSSLQILSFDNPMPAAVTPLQIGSLQAFNPLRIILPTSNAVYDQDSEQIVGIISREKTLIRHHTASGNSSALPLPTFVTAPIFLQGNCYGIDIPNGYSSGGTATFSIVQIDPATGLFIDSLALSSNSFDYRSFFHHESISAATDGQDQLFFLGGTNLVMIQVSTGQVKVIDLYPNFNSSNDFVRFYGLEFRSANRLLAVREGSDDPSELVEIQIVGNVAQVGSLFDFSEDLPALGDWTLNREFYSTVYDACKNQYHIATLASLNPQTTTKLINVDLNSRTAQQQIVADYWFGINLME